MLCFSERRNHPRLPRRTIRGPCTSPWPAQARISPYRQELFSLYRSASPQRWRRSSRGGQKQAASDTSTESGRETVRLQSAFQQAETVDGTVLAPDRLAVEHEPRSFTRLNPSRPAFSICMSAFKSRLDDCILQRKPGPEDRIDRRGYGSGHCRPHRALYWMH